MKYAYTVVYVRDVNQSVEFYERAVGLSRRFVHESGEYAEMETGPTVLALIEENFGRGNTPGGFRANTLAESPAGVVLCFAVDDVAEAYQRAVREGATPLSEPELKPWGQEVAFVRDPDGLLIEFDRWVQA